MGTITTTDGTEIFYKDWGSGQPIVFSHGWPLSADDWDTQMLFFLGHGYRVIAHDRRGHGNDLVVVAVHHQDRHRDLLEVPGEIGLGEEAIARDGMSPVGLLLGSGLVPSPARNADVLIAEVAPIAEYDQARTGGLETPNSEGLREPAAVGRGCRRQSC